MSGAVDWDQPIEAVERATGRVVPMKFVGSGRVIFETAEANMLRDYFAGQALAAVISLLEDEYHIGVDIENRVAIVSYRIADAMLVERAKAVQS